MLWSINAALKSINPPKSLYKACCAKSITQYLLEINWVYIPLATTDEPSQMRHKTSANNKNRLGLNECNRIKQIKVPCQHTN